MKWHLDLDTARDEASRTKKPILSLALLGRLDEELSCANSRYFRLTLYSDPAVAQLMKEQFVLHWRTVRPVPKVRIDFGDGRVVERTVTGNSAHLILDDQGLVADAIPGLYGPKTFMRALAGGVKAARSRDLVGHHRDRLARPAIPLDDVAFSKESIDLIRQKLPPPPARKAGALAATKMRFEDPLLTFLESLRASVAEDTKKNERDLHRRVHEAFANNQAPREREAFVSWLYGELFLMPLDDPWLGLGTTIL